MRCNNLWIMYTNSMPTYLSQINQSHGRNSVNLDITAKNAHQNEEGHVSWCENFRNQLS